MTDTPDILNLCCIECPNGCELAVKRHPDGAITVEGAKCKHGTAFAIAEMTAPMRTISSIAATAFPRHPVLPVRVSAPIPKDKIFPVMDEIARVTVKTPVRRGDVIIPNVLGLNVDIISTSDMLSKEDVINE